MVIREGFFLVAQKLQEAADMAHSNVRNTLRDAVYDAHRKSGDWADYIDHTGDGTSGDVYYRAGGETRSAPYEISDLAGKVSANVDVANAKKVTPFVEYREMAGDDDYYTAMQEAFVKAKTYTELPLYERFIAKAERDKATEDSFAGKNKSFPILKPADVGAAVHAMGRAGSDNYGVAQLKANIIKIAKAKGWDDELPKSWRGTTKATATSEASPAPNVARETTLSLVESDGCGFLEEIQLQEAVRSNYPVKIISPGTGSTAHYPAAVLERDGPKLFKKGTLMFWNHQTSKESAERPEGDLNQLAAILTSDATYKATGPKGPGLYAEAKVMADYAERVAERAPHIGLSIRAGGSTDGSKIDGKPVLKSIDYVESVDYVTKAGRGGLALAEAARDAGILPEEGDTDMKLEEAQALVAEAVKNATAPLLLNQMRRDARDEGSLILESVTLPAAAKTKIIERAVRSVDDPASGVIKDGVLQLDKFREVVVREAKAEGEYLREITGSGSVRGMGAGSPFQQPLTEAQREEATLRAKRARKAEKVLREGAVDVFARLTNGNRDAAAAAANKGVAA